MKVVVLLTNNQKPIEEEAGVADSLAFGKMEYEYADALPGRASLIQPQHQEGGLFQPCNWWFTMPLPLTKAPSFSRTISLSLKIGCIQEFTSLILRYTTPRLVYKVDVDLPLNHPGVGTKKGRGELRGI